MQSTSTNIEERTQADACLTLTCLFDAMVAFHPERIAISAESVQMTYAELDAQAQRVAHGLQRMGIRPGSLVAILLEREPRMIVAMLAVIKAGAAYLPLDSSYPAARIVATIADAAPAALITSHDMIALDGAPLLMIEDLLHAETLSGKAIVPVDPNDTAYVIYTSGSTGTPKGVVVSHYNVVRLFSQTQALFHFGPNDVWTMFHSFAFDFSVWEIWGCLLHGGRLVIVPYLTSRAPDLFRALVGKERVTVLSQTPSAFALLDQADALDAADALSLRLILFGGEALAGVALAAWFDRHGDKSPQLINMYGITETTVHVTWRRMLQQDVNERSSLIGQPLADLRLYVLDQALRPVGDGEEGELCIGGAGVTSGYLRRSALTAERFVPDPFGLPGERLYRSGDIARRRPDGELVYLGRRDGQVKINGFRIEAGEIESALLVQPSITQTCVITRPGPDGKDRLLAYFTATCRVDLEVLRKALRAILPPQMVPAQLHQVPAFPLNSNGKIDHAALPEPEAAVSALASSFVAGSEMEVLVTRIWRQVLGIRAFAHDDNFFDLGGTSLLLIAARTGLQEQLDRSIPVTWMFECTTVRTLAARLAAGTVQSAPVTQKVRPGAGSQRQSFARARALRGGLRA